MKSHIHITKASGLPALYSEAKLRSSLHRAGASPEQIDNVVSEITGKLYEGIPTKKLYRMAFNLLKGSSRFVAAKYRLKKAIMELGPSGYPFEKFIGEIMKHQGYAVSVNQMVKGACVGHEIDVIAVADGLKLMVECKYHNRQGVFCDVKIPLYIQARFKDVESEWLKDPAPGIHTYRGGVATNTRFSSDAIKYGTCAGLKLMSWDYPGKESLKSLIDSLRLYPITCLTSLSRSEKQHLIGQDIVLCKELQQHEQLLSQAGVGPSRIGVVLQEIHQLCGAPEHIK